MSNSSLWLLDNDFKGHEHKKYENSWLYSPIAWDVLLEKYLHKEIQTPYGHKKSTICSMDGGLLHNKLNEIVNKSNAFYDRIVWEMSNQQVFLSRDKEIIAENIRMFVESNKAFDKSDDGTYPLQLDHIMARFHEIAEDIEAIDESEYICFVFKSSNCDDGVESWFSKYNAEEDEYETTSLKEVKSDVAEFVIINNNCIEFLTNIEYFEK